ncbi:hypothetical protein FISHEDRAFT_46168 [Fistulina hepatica ATCC 64428]|uniref:Uncharacterized protein n=1 Tax=Fistulina hepatica ATCC 64428 TaxID=1128425 RepID=A0A0D7A9E5_9AGAR|nr:hypothetical protein FISHEDRAFT_46168 [Fistulina hepatica ATCC 64428]
MFSQLRHAVENFATVLPESTTTSTSTAHDRSQSHDVTPSTSSDPTFANLRRSLDFVAPAQRRRAQSPGNNLSSVRSPSAARTPSVPIPSPLSGRKLNLEERLRAKFTIGDESNQTSPDPSARASPSISPSISPRSSASNESFPLQKDHASPPDVSSSSPDPPSPIPGTTLPFSDPDLCSSSPSSSRDELATKDLPSSNDAQKDAEAPADEQHAGDADLPKSLESLAEASSDPPARRPELDTSVPSTSESSSSHNVDAMQERLKLVEQRFAEVSASFKRLRAEKTAVDVILQDLTPIDTLSDSEGLRDYLKNLTLKNEVSSQFAWKHFMLINIPPDVSARSEAPHHQAKQCVHNSKEANSISCLPN